MKGPITVFAALALHTLVGCAEETIEVPLRSLERSGAVSFVCVDPMDDSGHPGRHIDDCPLELVRGDARLYGLVTQTTRGEVAVIDVIADGVVDFDPATPGFNFVPVGANPEHIVSTPGGQASFVGAGEPGREGLYALASSCILPPARDLVSFPACALPSAPGELFMILDAPGTGSSCPAPAPAPTPAGECHADLSEEPVLGRHKILAVLPSEGAVAVIDAQSVLDRAPGSFDSCPIERLVALDTALPGDGPTQQLPPDLDVPGCGPDPLEHGPIEATASDPGGAALVESTLYVSDRGAPIVHVLDFTDACAPVARPPLLPASYLDPGRTVTTTDVAVSPPTSRGDRFAYAIDSDGSVMIFDVSPTSADRTPIVRPRSPRFPFEPPDRIAFSAPARDVEFVNRDRPIADPVTGVAIVGEACEPHFERAEPETPGALYRPSEDLSTGASPGNLRGVFGLVALTSGLIAVIDVDDFDASCRRPTSTIAATVGGEDFRGCADDEGEDFFFTTDGTRDGRSTVTNEVSCQIVQPHRSRSGSTLRVASSGSSGAPGVRSLPRLGLDGATLPSTQTVEGRASPRILAVPFGPGDGEKAQLVAGSSLLTEGGEDDTALDISPGTAEANSVTLTWSEPRAFSAEEDYSAVYEGEIIGTRAAGVLALEADDPEFKGLVDSSANFCARGVEDMDAAKDVAQRLGVASGDFGRFARRHADYVQVVQPLLDEDDSYWKSGVGASCGDAASPAGSFLACRLEFGTDATPTTSRDLVVVEAYQDQLVLEPRTARGGARQRLVEMVECCFPTAVAYRVRAGHQWVVTGSGAGFRHGIKTDIANGPRGKRRCVPDCNPLRALQTSRAFELTVGRCTRDMDGALTCPASTDDLAVPAVGAALPEDVACVLADADELIVGDARGSHPCIFESLTHRFAIYRGATQSEAGVVAPSPSVRDMAFTWQVTGGFRPLVIPLAVQTSNVAPQSMVFVPQISRVAVVDGAADGLALVSLDSLRVSRLFF